MYLFIWAETLYNNYNKFLLNSHYWYNLIEMHSMILSKYE